MQDRDLSKIPFLPYKGFDGFGLKSPRWFRKQDGSRLRMAGYFSNKKGKFLFAYKNKHPNIHFWFCWLSASAQSHRKGCAHCAEDSPPHPSTCTFVSHHPWKAFLHGFASQIIGLVQLRAWPKDRLWSPSSPSTLTLLPFPLHSSQSVVLHSSSQSVVLIQLQPPAGACPGARPDCSSLAAVGLLTAAFQLGLKTASSWCFPTRDVFLPVGVCVFESCGWRRGGNIPFNQGCSTSTSQCLLTSLSKLPLHAF